jgi:signal transduction histidine kinase
MKQHELAPERVRELTELGVSQARKQEGMIQGILEVFASEISALEAFERDPARAPDLIRAARSAAEMVRPAFDRKNVALVLAGDPSAPAGRAAPRPSEPPPSEPPPASERLRVDERLLVVGHPQRLERVIANLLDNALRHSSLGSTVELCVVARGATARVLVDDRGPGVPEDLRAQLFQKFVQDPALGGTAGLGLYFCRMNIERWGGRIGCEPRAGGGSRFWFDLPRVSPGESAKPGL